MTTYTSLVAACAVLVLGSSVHAQRTEIRRNTILRVEATAYCDEGQTASGAYTVSLRTFSIPSLSTKS